ncbi:unnamed protein product [Bursaphelenchus okinawaensis]|uniref:Sodium/hydrogen exchanger n=1 Tax=Bursaphelenchus okinawaensis TaxID=465554 RepID=A0A811LJB9_9BILA|nr:unnamed protein product [Bursaphelenchus okinawaensis]CAG9127186.1 unnamed protein product [Bursaphelenchus okinawaensis]
MARTMFILLVFTVMGLANASFHHLVHNEDEDLEVATEKRANMRHQMDSLIMLVFTVMFVIIVVTAWFFKHYKIRFLHESGVTLIYGLILGLIFRYTDFGTIESQTLEVKAQNGSSIFVPPDYLRLQVSKPQSNETIHFHYEMSAGFYSDTAMKEKHTERKTVFSPEIFFNVLLPPVIFNAGYSLKKRHFFRNIGSILSFVFIGCTISSILTCLIMFVFCWIFRLGFTFVELLFFGALISATDPVTVLAVFSEMNVDVDLYALVFGESALNDAVAIVLSGIVDQFTAHSAAFSVGDLLSAFIEFGYVFFGSLLLGCFVGCSNALITKFTDVNEYPLLESALFVLVSYISFLFAEVVHFTGIVAVLFCGICQAHYTFNNLSEESQQRTKQFFEVISFLAESFIFLYIGVSLPTARAQWSIIFVGVAFVATQLSRALWVYPMCSILNTNRKPKIERNHQHMIVWSGLKGAVPFALASRNTATEHRQIMQSTTSILILFTVLINGGLAGWMIEKLGIKHGKDVTQQTASSMAETENEEDTDVLNANNRRSGRNPWDKAFLPRKWYNFDAVFMKPLLTNANPTLMETLPGFCAPVARMLTTEKQLRNRELKRTQELPNFVDSKSDESPRFDANPRTV